MQICFELAYTECAMWRGDELEIEPRRQQVARAIATFEAAGATDGVVQALSLLSVTEQDSMQAERTRAAAERLLEIGRGSGNALARTAGERALAIALLDGPVPTDEAIARLRELVRSTRGPTRGTPMQFLAELLAARCEFDQAREMLAE